MEYSESLFLKDIGLTEAKENDSKEMLQGPTLTNFKVHKEVAYKDAKYLGHQCSYQFKDKNRMGLHRVAFHEAVSM